jgi:outer membrane protein
MNYRLCFIIFLLPGLAYGQEALNDYIRYGLENNLVLKQKQFDYERTVEALREARGLFYPTISFNARYSIARGGRIIDFPAGDLLNPVYMTLNTLTASGLFPMIENQQIKFLRPHEHETKIRITQPLFNSDIYFNTRIKKELSLYQEMDVEQYKRELKAEIKKAYYNAAMATSIVSMLTETRKLLVENIRVNRRLAENGKVTPDNLYRSEAELSKFEQEFQNAEKDYKIACAYFNFLLNRPLTDSIIIQQPETYPVPAGVYGNITQEALENREELKKLMNYEMISGLQIRMNESEKLPDVIVVADFGYQGEEYEFNRDQDYMLASAVLTWNLFEGFANKAKVKQAKLQKEIAGGKLAEARKNIELQVLNVVNELRASEKGIKAAESRLKNAREGFRLINRKYEEGQASLIEFIDARTNLTQAEGNLIISKFHYLSVYAEFENVIAIK